MTYKELKKLSRQELINLVIAQGNKISRIQNKLADALEVIDKYESLGVIPQDVIDSIKNSSNLEPKENAETIAEEVKVTVEETVDNAVETVEEVTEEVSDAAEEVFEAVEMAQEEVFEAVEMAQEEVIESVEEIAEDSIEAVEDTNAEAEDIAEEIAEAAEEIVEDAAVETEDIIETAEKCCEEAVTRENTVQGFVLTEDNFGDLAEYATSITGIMTKAQETAEIYLENIKQLKADTEAQCNEKIEITDRQCAEKIELTDRQCAEKIESVDKECEEKLSEANAYFTTYKDHSGKNQLLLESIKELLKTSPEIGDILEQLNK